MYELYEAALKIISSHCYIYMKATLNKIISSLFLLLATLPLIFAAYIQTSEAVIHHRMQEELEQKNLVTIHVNSSQLIWTNKGKEASINGNMFDVEKFSVTGNDVQLTGLFDRDEDALFAHINNQQQNNSDATAGTSVLKWFGCFSWNANNIITQCLCSSTILSPQKIQQNNILQEPFLSCDIPPPKFG